MNGYISYSCYKRFSVFDGEVTGSPTLVFDSNSSVYIETAMIYTIL